MSTDLFWEHACIHYTQTPDTMNPALRVDDTCRRRWAHTRRANWMIQSEGLLIHEPDELLVGDIVDVAARERPPVRSRIVIHWDGLEEFLEGWTPDDLETNTNADQKNIPVVFALVAQVLRVDDRYSDVWSASIQIYYARAARRNLRASKTSLL